VARRARRYSGAHGSDWSHVAPLRATCAPLRLKRSFMSLHVSIFYLPRSSVDAAAVAWHGPLRRPALHRSTRTVHTDRSTAVPFLPDRCRHANRAANLEDEVALRQDAAPPGRTLTHRRARDRHRPPVARVAGHLVGVARPQRLDLDSGAVYRSHRRFKSMRVTQPQPTVRGHTVAAARRRNAHHV
jgi:hypothetical protein